MTITKKKEKKNREKERIFHCFFHSLHHSMWITPRFPDPSLSPSRQFSFRQFSRSTRRTHRFHIDSLASVPQHENDRSRIRIITHIIFSVSSMYHLRIVYHEINRQSHRPQSSTVAIDLTVHRSTILITLCLRYRSLDR